MSTTNEDQWNECCACEAKDPVEPSPKRLSSVKLNRAVLGRDPSFESGGAISRCSSIESMLESRRADPEEVLIGLGFGPPPNSSIAARIPQRFLRPSKLLNNIDINKFLEQYGEVPGMDNRFSSMPNSPARQRPRSS